MSDMPFLTVWPEDLMLEEEQTPRSEWDAYNGTTTSESNVSEERESAGPRDMWDGFATELARDAKSEESHWSEFTYRW